MRAPLLALAAAAAVIAGPVVAQQAPAQPAPRATAVTVTTAAERDLRDRLLVTGTFVARDEVLVTAEVDGLAIAEILAEEGQRVTAGQVLARLDRRGVDVQLQQNAAQIARAEAAVAQANSQIAEADASRDQANQALERTRVLARTGAASADVLDQRTAAARVAEARVAQTRQALALAQADLKIAQAQRDDLMLRLSRTEIKARSGGIVSRRTARLGAIAAASGDPLFRIIAEGAIELEADVPEISLARIRAGQSATVEPIGRERPIEASVRLVSPEVNRTTRLGRIRIALGDTEGVAIGTFGRGNVEVARTRGVAVPLSSVLFTAQGAFVQVVKDGVIDTRRVDPGLRADGFVEIRSGVASGEDVVTVSGTFLRAGDRVTPVRADRTAAAR